MDKDRSIIDVVARLRESMGDGAFDIVDHGEADLCQIGIASPHDHKRLVYISTYGRKAGRYTVELELPPEPNSEKLYESGGWLEDIEFDELLQAAKSHLATE